MPTEYYEITRVTIPDIHPGESRLVTAAMLDCGLCGETIQSTGGPGEGPICLRCAELLMRGELRGAVKWERKN